MAEVLIIGGGAAGMAAAVFAGEAGHHVRIFEKNEKLGKKLFITGKGRCNFTNACDMEEYFHNVVSNPKFLYSAFYSFTNEQAIDFFERLGVRTKVERGNRAFPASDHSSDIIRGMERRMKELGVSIHLNTRVRELLEENESIVGICLENGKKIFGDHVILATGGCSYPVTGSDGDGYQMARQVGIPVTTLRPALVPLVVKEDYIPMMQGLSLRNVELTIRDKKKILYNGFGELLFTHFGISGPLVLSASSFVGKKLGEGPLQATIDLKPALTFEKLDQRLIREFEAARNTQFKNALGGLFPSKLVPVILALSEILPDKKVNEITREERQGFIRLMKSFPMTIVKTRGFGEAIITQGGIDTRSIHPSTMETKQLRNLHVIGEVLDLDALTGGFNLQIAWSTAYAAVQGIS